MSHPQPPAPGKLVISALTARRSLLAPVAADLAARFGPIDSCGPWWQFDFTRYYHQELGGPLQRRMLSFQKLLDPGQLAQAKLHTNQLESRYSQQGRRCINLDPGLLSTERFVLATGKNFSHRIYIGMNIYADLTLIYTQGRFQTLPWTYPDYAEEKMLAYLTRVRNKYGRDLKQK